MRPGHALIGGAGIGGAGIGGPATAYWLNQHGWDTTLVERAGELRTGGRNVDVRGAARARRAGNAGNRRP